MVNAKANAMPSKAIISSIANADLCFFKFNPTFADKYKDDFYTVNTR
jgi:hypothetical protein